ncbi:MAG: carboxymuconolactone decarboxylase [Lysobacterales bacterium CG17_big_fil_post_rev_8_21_14_2_50_64_11]|nr:MAG: carboxymuconolactone decarboxylase [Xanthomonadales bacterium CG17_big_fil_post_rev_8_21_14_2_50_64_11]PIX60743.1 MAG: carboxymuconolactone decarboxylase [Xanthomonadales bacterium CG_4_10_14_3_um_filter_64_11]
MAKFTLHTPESAPEAARETLAKVQENYGFLPNLLAGLAEAPTALHSYLALSEQFGKTALSAPEQQVVLLATSVINECQFCVAAHSYLARNVAKLDEASIKALRDGNALPDARLNALARFTRAVVSERGWVNGPALDAFLAAGFSKAQVLEVVLGVTTKTLSNYANHVLETPTNQQFAADAWQPKRKTA